MMGWLVVNHYLKTPKFLELYGLLKRAAEQQGARLQIKTNADLCCTPSGEFIDPSLQPPDFVLFWDKDLLLAQRLEDMGLKVYNSARAIGICDDKALTAYACRHLPMPKTLPLPFTYENVGYTETAFLAEAGEFLGWPMVMKECKGSFGFGVHLAHNHREAEAVAQSLQGKPALLQQFIAQSRGRDIRVNVVGGQVHSAMLRENPADFRSNISNGGQGQPYCPTPEESALAVAACQSIGLAFGGVDLLQTENGPLLCEVNSNPHFKSTLDATGRNMADAILAHVFK